MNTTQASRPDITAATPDSGAVAKQLLDNLRAAHDQSAYWRGVAQTWYDAYIRESEFRGQLEDQRQMEIDNFLGQIAGLQTELQMIEEERELEDSIAREKKVKDGKRAAAAKIPNAG